MTELKLLAIIIILTNATFSIFIMSGISQILHKLEDKTGG